MFLTNAEILGTDWLEITQGLVASLGEGMLEKMAEEG